MLFFVIEQYITFQKTSSYTSLFIPDSPSASRGKKGDPKSSHCDNNNAEEAPSVIFDSPHSSKNSNSARTAETISRQTPMDVSALVDGDNAMFPDAPLFSGTENGTDVGTDLEAEAGTTIEMFVETLNKGCDKISVKSSPGGSRNVPQNQTSDNGNVMQDRFSDSSQDLEELENRKTALIVESGITEESAQNMTLAELYLMFGKEGKLKLEYDWTKDKSASVTMAVTNLLRRLIHLANIEFTDFCTKVVCTRGVRIQEKHIAIYCDIFSLYCDRLLSLYFQ